MIAKRWVFGIILLLAGVASAAITDIPSGLVVSEGFYPDRVVVRWTPVGGAQAYRVYRSTRPDPSFRVVLGSWQQGNIFADRSAEVGVRYYYWVKAAATSAGAGASDFSEMDSGYLRLDQLAQPVARALFAGATSGVELAWSEVLGARYYQVSRSTRLDPASAQTLSAWLDEKRFVDNSAVPGVRYYYYVKASVDNSGQRTGDFSAPLSASRGVSPPRGLGAESALDGVQLNWQAAAGAQLYQVWRSALADSSAARAVSGWLSAQNFTDSSAQPGASYNYWVKASGGQGTRASAFGGRATAYRSLRKPLLRGIELRDGALELTWGSVEGGDYYRVYRGQIPVASTARPLAIWQRDLSLVDASAMPGVRYYYWVEAASNIAGNRASGFAAALNSVVPLQKPLAPQVEEVEGNSVLLNWSAVVGGRYYRVYRAEREDVRQAAPLGDWQQELSFADALARPGVRYYYWVEVATDATGRLSSGPSDGAVRFLSMPAPAGFNASQGSYFDQIELRWQPVAGAQYYRVYRSKTAQPSFHTVLSQWQGDTRFIDQTAEPSVRYYYWVKAALDESGAGAGAFSVVADGYLGGRVLLAPSVVSATDGESPDQIVIRWDEVVGGNYYRIYRANSLVAEEALPLSGWQEARQFVDRGVRPGQVYYYFVRAAADARGSLASELRNANSGYRALAPPGRLQASAGLATTVEMEWAPVSGAKFYRIYRSRQEQAASARPVGSWQENTRFADPTAIPGATYYYWVKAASSSAGLNASKLSVGSSGFRALAAPARPSVAAQDKEGVRLQWPAVLGANYYQVLRSANADMAAAEPLGDWIASAIYQDVSATPGVTYYYFVRAAVDAEGVRKSTTSSTAASFRFLAEPQDLLLDPRDESMHLQWAAVQGASYYQVLRSASADIAAAEPISGWLSASAYEDETVVPGVTYYYFVRAAIDGSGSRAGAATGVSGHRSLGIVTAFDAQGGDPDRVALRWQAVDQAAAYQVYRSERPDAERAEALSGWMTATEFIDESAGPGVITYYFVRAAADVAGTNPGPFTPVQSAYRGLRGPSILSVSRSGIGEVSLQWTGVEGASHYRAYRSTSADTSLAEPLSGWQADVSTVDATADPGVEYHYFVRAATSNLGHRASSFGGGGQGVRRLLAPARVLGSTGDIERVRIAWAPVEGASHYQVYRTHDLQEVLVHPVSDWLDEAFYEDADTEPGVQYHYFVRAASGTNGEAASGFSNETIAYRGLQAPVRVAVSQGDLDSVELQWPAVVGARYYQVYRSVTTDALGARAISGWMTATSLVDSTLAPGQERHYFVRAAMDGVGGNASALSAVASGYRGLYLPTNLQASTGDSAQVSLSWSPVSGATHYQVFRGLSAEAAAAQAIGAAWQTETSFVDAEVDSGQVYHYLVRAASDDQGQIVSDYSASARGYAQVTVPVDFQVVPDGGLILLRWDANDEFDISEYRVYGGGHPDSTSVIASVAQDIFPQLNIASVLPLPAEFNLVDMGLSLLDNRETIVSAFERMFERVASNFEVEELFAGRRLQRDEIAPLNREKPYYFSVVAVNGSGRESAPAQGRVFSASSVPVLATSGDARVEVSWIPVWGADYYRVYRHTSDRADIAEPLGPWQQQTQLIDNSAVPGVHYYYFLRTARSAAGEDESGFSQATMGYRGLAAPAVVSATRDLADRIEINWITVPGAVAYRVFHNVENDIESAEPLAAWQAETSFEHVAAAPGDNFYWVRASNNIESALVSPLSLVSPGRRTAPLAMPSQIEASWGDFKDHVQVLWQREPAASHVRLFRGTTTDPQLAQPISDWVEWNGFEDRSAESDVVYYYFVQVASSASGLHASGLSVSASGIRSGAVSIPKGLVTTTTPGKIYLSWQPNPEDDLLHYRVYGGHDPEALVLIDSVRADEDPRAVIRDIVPLPGAFNIVDMGLGLSASRTEIRTRFTEYFYRSPLEQWIDELFAGNGLNKDDITALEVGRTYYFKVAAVNGAQQASIMSEATEVLVTEVVAGKIVQAFGDASIETGIEPNAPNPFNSSTLLRFALRGEAVVNLRIYDILGQVVRQVADGQLAAGRYAVAWDGRDHQGRNVGSGVYFYALVVGEQVYPGRMLLVR
jgi:fibronectin type 3 domain-containing protein